MAAEHDDLESAMESIVPTADSGAAEPAPPTADSTAAAEPA